MVRLFQNGPRLESKILPQRISIEKCVIFVEVKLQENSVSKKFLRTTLDGKKHNFALKMIRFLWNIIFIASIDKITSPMKKLLSILFLVLLSLNTISQNDYWARLSFSGVSELGISPSEEIWVATRSGNVFYTKQIGELWHLGSFGSLDPWNHSSGKTFERINFFDENTMMISGFIHENRKQDIVFWSGNHGTTWEKVVFGISSWIDAAYINNNGKAWMSGSSQLIYYTEDKGKTWITFDKAGDENALRFSTIHFAKDEKTGLFGSFWNVLYRTLDNCQNWEKLPTPLSQGKYERIDKEDRPDIRKIRIFGSHYVINQQGKVFITKADLIDWIHLPNVVDFEVSEDESLYTINQDLSISLYDSNFIQTWHSNKSLNQIPSAISVRNNSLFALTDDFIYKINQKNFIASLIFTDETPIREPYLKLNFEDEEYGFVNKDVLHFDKNKKAWHRLMTLDFSIAHAHVFQGAIVLTDQTLNSYYALDLKQMSVHEYFLPEKLFSNLKVKEVLFESGSQGCFHHNHSQLLYKRKGESFVIDKKSSTSGFLSSATNNIDAKKIEQIVDLVDQSRFTKVTMADLNITKNDINTFKKFIDSEEQRIKKSGRSHHDYDNLFAFPKGPINFDFYRSLADSLNFINEEDINNAFWKASGNRSTTTKWLSITFVFTNDQKLTIQNNDDRPNYLNTPWVVDFDGLKFRTNSIRFGQLIDSLTKGQFFDEVVRDEKYAIFKIIDYKYRKQLNEK